MFDWLFEGWLEIYILLAVLAFARILAVWPFRRKVWLITLFSVIALIGVYWLLDRLVETDREQIERKLTALAVAMHSA